MRPPRPRRTSAIQKIAILGGKGGGTIAAQVVLNLARANGSHALVGYLNDRLPKATPLHGAQILCSFNDWRSLDAEICFVAPLHKAGHIQANSARVMSLGIPESRWATLVDPMTSVADGAVIGHGTVAAAFASIQPDTRIGAHCYLRMNAVVSHDVALGDFVYVGAHATISGYCRVGNGVHIGPGATLRDGVTIGDHAVIGLGAVVTGDVPADSVVAGNPARAQGRDK